MALQVRVLCDVSSLPADAVAVDLLARLQLAARRHGGELRLCGASQALRELIAFCGLESALGDRSPTGALTDGGLNTAHRARPARRQG